MPKILYSEKKNIYLHNFDPDEVDYRNEPFYEVKGVLQRTKIIGDFGRIETLYVYRLTVMLYRCVDDDIPDYKSSKTLYWNNYYNEEALRQAIKLLDEKVSAVVEILAGGEVLF